MKRTRARVDIGVSGYVSTKSAAREIELSDQPPGPRGLPYFGCLNSLLRDPMLFWSSVANRYGGIARVPLKGRHVFLVSDPDLLYELLVTKRRRYRKNVRYQAAIDTFGEGLLLSEGDRWNRQRLITQPAFRNDYIRSQVPSMSAITKRYLDEWASAASDGSLTRDVEIDFLKLTQTLAGHYLMGPGFAEIDERFHAAAIAIKNNWPIPPRSVLALYKPKGKKRQTEFDAAIRAADACIFEYLEAQKKTDFEDAGVMSLLVHKSREQGDEYDAKSLRDQFMSLFFAGHETSAMSLAWAHYLLWQHDGARAKLKQEVDSVLGTREPAAEDVDQLEFTECVLNETLRLYSPIHSISRVALEDDSLGGYSIPAGAMIYISLYAIHRLPAIWPNPDEFDPERFLPERSVGRPRFAFIPFAAGHRNCIGASMAVVELKLVIALIAQRFVLDLAPGHRVRTSAETTMRPRYGMRMTIQER